MVEISIIMPVYNSQDHLKDTLDYILNQTFDDFELICVNDGSGDDSLDILNDYSFKDSRIKVFSQENKGQGSARNKGLEHCTGKYVYFMDADDCIIPEFLELVHDNIKNNSSEIVMFKTGNIESGNKIDTPPLFPFDEVFKDADFNDFTFDYTNVRKYVLNSSFAPWTKFYKKELFDRYDDFKFNENLPYEDVLFHIKSMLRASRISFVPEYLYYYRIDNPNSSSFNYESHIKIFDVIDEVEEFLKKENYLNDFEKEFEFFKLRQITYHMITPINEEHFKLAKQYLNGIDIDENDLIPDYRKKEYQIFYENDDAKTYEREINLYLLQREQNELKEKNRKLEMENSQLKQEKSELESKKEEILSSRSWKLTKVFRSIFNLFRRN